MNGEKLENAKNALFIALGIDIAVTAVVLASHFWMVGVLNGIAAGGPAASPSVVGYIEFWEDFSKTIILTMFGVGWALIHWLDACYTYAEESLKATGLLHKKWKTWGWIVPFLNLFKPYQVLNEIYKVGAIGGVESNDWKKSSSSGALLTWWIFWLISHMVMMGIAKEILKSSSLVGLNLNQIVGIINSQIVLGFISLVVAGIWFMVADSLTGRLLDRSSKPTGRVVSSSAANAGAAVPPFFSSHDLIQKMASEIATLPSGRLGGITCLGLSVMGLGMLVILNTMTAPDLTNKFYKELGSASGAAFFGYLSYWFYSGKSDPQFGMFRISLSIALVSGLLAASEGVESGVGSWKAVVFIASTVFFVVAAWKANVTARRKNQASRVSRSLRASSGVLIWVPIVFAGIPVIGIVAAVALPAYQDYTKRQASALEADPYAEFLDRKPNPTQAQRDLPWEQQQYSDGVAAAKRGDYVSAAAIFHPLAEMGHLEAQFNLGSMYHFGNGVPKDYIASAKWYRLAANQGHALAQSQLGMMYDAGEGVLQNYPEAVKLHRMAAAQGDSTGQTNLGIAYAMGRGVQQDYVKAHMWLNLAGVSGASSASQSRDAIANSMTPQQIAQAQQMARECQKRNFQSCD